MIPTPIPGCPDYGATRDGRIWSQKKGGWKSLALSEIAPRSYLKVNLSIDGKSQTFRVAFLIASTFIGPRPASEDGQRIEINHKDLNRQNNADWNLEYLPQRCNIDHALRARGHRGVKSAETLLSEMLAALRTNFRREHMTVIPLRGQCRGERMRNRKLTNATVRRMRALHGVRSLSEIGRQFGVSKQTVWRVVHRLKWRHL